MRQNGQWQQKFAPLSAMPPMQRLAAADENDVTDFASKLHAGFDLGAGPLFGTIFATLPDGSGRLILAAHHLIVDGVSWRMIVADIERHYLETGTIRSGASRAGSWKQPAFAVGAFRRRGGILARHMRGRRAGRCHSNNESGSNTQSGAVTYRQTIDAETTSNCLGMCRNASASPRTKFWSQPFIWRCGNGAESHVCALKWKPRQTRTCSRISTFPETVGWLTGFIPVLFDTPDEATPDRLLLDVKDTLRRIPNNGVGFGVLKYLRNKGERLDYGKPQVRFNYLGQMDAMFAADSLLRRQASHPSDVRPDNPRDAILEINAMVVRGELQLQWVYGAQLHSEDTIRTLAGHFRDNLETLIQHCLNGSGAGFSPSDFPLMDLGQDELDNLLKSL
ncbi:condensation domain-containing protein [Rhizobium sp. AN6A]|uniref:condensation domain-containing protein n=1 Tax=Rhizobium sp. AN6A TaxID=1841611 RepID=UPI002B233541|nr:condensation domain-containing protein [Rhizobium sp. AN6A]